MQTDEKARKLLEDAAANNPGNLRDASKKLHLKDLLKDLRDALCDSAGKLEEAARKTGNMEAEPVGEDNSHRKISDLNCFYSEEAKNYGKETILLVQIRNCLEKVMESCKRATDMLEKSLEKYERIENRISETEKGGNRKKAESRPSVKRKLETLQERNQERTGKVAEEERGKEAIR